MTSAANKQHDVIRGPNRFYKGERAHWKIELKIWSEPLNIIIFILLLIED